MAFKFRDVLVKWRARSSPGGFVQLGLRRLSVLSGRWGIHRTQQTVIPYNIISGFEADI